MLKQYSIIKSKTDNTYQFYDGNYLQYEIIILHYFHIVTDIFCEIS
jgi:hypothetical protein